MQPETAHPANSVTILSFGITKHISSKGLTLDD